MSFSLNSRGFKGLIDAECLCQPALEDVVSKSVGDSPRDRRCEEWSRCPSSVAGVAVGPKGFNVQVSSATPTSEPNPHRPGQPGPDDPTTILLRERHSSLVSVLHRPLLSGPTLFDGSDRPHRIAVATASTKPEGKPSALPPCLTSPSRSVDKPSTIDRRPRLTRQRMLLFAVGKLGSKRYAQGRRTAPSSKAPCPPPSRLVLPP